MLCRIFLWSNQTLSVPLFVKFLNSDSIKEKIPLFVFPYLDQPLYQELLRTESGYLLISYICQCNLGYTLDEYLIPSTVVHKHEEPSSQQQPTYQESDYEEELPAELETHLEPTEAVLPDELAALVHGGGGEVIQQEPGEAALPFELSSLIQGPQNKRRKRREWMPAFPRTTPRPRRQPTTRQPTTTTTTTTPDTEELSCPTGFRLFSWGSSKTCMKFFGKHWLNQAHTKCSSGSELPLPASAEEQLRRGRHICKTLCREEASGWNFNTFIFIAKLELRYSISWPSFYIFSYSRPKLQNLLLQLLSKVMWQN